MNNNTPLHAIDERLQKLAGSAFPHIRSSKEAATAGLRDKSPNVRQACIALLTKVFDVDDVTINELEQLERDSNALVRSSARFWLANNYRNLGLAGWRSKLSEIVVDDGNLEGVRLHAYCELLRSDPKYKSELTSILGRLELASLIDIDWEIVEKIRTSDNPLN